MEIMKGNEAIAESAIRAGARLYAGYPITPSSEIMEYVSWRLAEVGGAFIQAESEIAGIHMLVGGASCGVRSFTASSGPGIALKQEGISVLSDEQLPAVIINVVRYGIGIGTLFSAQVDYARDTRRGGNGDYHHIVLCPSTVQEACELTMECFDLAEKYRMVCILMTEGSLGQMIEAVELPEMREVKRYDWAFDGKYTNKLIGIFDRDSVKEAKEINEKYALVEANEQRYETYNLDDAEYVYVAFGLSARSAEGAMEELRAEGKKVGMIRIISAWPFPIKAFQELSPQVKALISVESNSSGQLVEDIALTSMKLKLQDVKIYVKPFIYGVPAVKEIKKLIGDIESGELKEKY